MVIDLLIGWVCGFIGGYALSAAVAHFKQVRRDHAEYIKYFE